MEILYVVPLTGNCPNLNYLITVDNHSLQRAAEQALKHTHSKNIITNNRSDSLRLRDMEGDCTRTLG